eukprot:366388-Chlamydomonas_euryale.AAC.15
MPLKQAQGMHVLQEGERDRFQVFACSKTADCQSQRAGVPSLIRQIPHQSPAIPHQVAERAASPPSSPSPPSPRATFLAVRACPHLVAHKCMASLDEVDSIRVQLVKIVRCVGHLPRLPSHPRDDVLRWSDSGGGTHVGVAAHFGRGMTDSAADRRGLACSRPTSTAGHVAVSVPSGCNKHSLTAIGLQV